MHGKSTQWRRRTVGDLKVGDRFAFTRNAVPETVTALSPGERSVWITCDVTGRCRPRKSKAIWLWIG